MARYFFDLSVGTTITRDEYGSICASDKMAVIHAWTALPHILSENSPILPWQHFELIVQREDGLHVGRLGVTVIVETQNPATALALGGDGSDRTPSAPLHR